MSSADQVDHSLDGESQSSTIIIISIVLVIFSGTLVLLRLFTRGFYLKAFGPDDATIAVSQILAVGTSIGTILQAQNGLGKHTWTVDPESNMRQLQSLYATILIYNPAQIMLKISLLLLFRRLFPGQKTQLFCTGMLVFIPVWGVTQEFLAGLACIPLGMIVPSMTGHCITTLPIWYLTSVMNIVTDFLIFFIPIPSITSLQLRKAPKYLLVGLFGLGFFTCIVSIIRLFTLRASIESTDPMWDNSATSTWSVVELNCGIACATLPTLRPLFARIFPAHFVSRIGQYRHRSRSGDGATKGTGKSSSPPGGDLETGHSGLVIRRDVELTVSSSSHLKQEKSNSEDGLVPSKPSEERKHTDWPLVA